MNQNTAPAVARQWSAYQLAIFRDVAEGKGHTVVVARAGSGKTSTIVEAFNHVPSGKSVLMVAFNKSIATELQARAPQGITVSTLHSFGLRALKFALGNKIQINAYHVDDLLKGRLGSERETLELRKAIAKVVSLAKSSLIDTADALDAIIDRHGIDCGDDREQIVAEAVKTLTECRASTTVIDFDDMIWLPVVLGLRPKQFDRVFVDETQDLNAAQIELALRAVKPNGRIMAVGDDRQAIYAFRGADEHAVNHVVERLHAKVMPLSVTYRCAKAIVAVAKTIVRDIEHAPNATEGEVKNVAHTALIQGTKPGDFILSRANAPLISLCMNFLKEGRRAHIQGRDVGANLLGLVKKSKAEDVPSLAMYVDAWCRTEVARLERQERDPQAVVDKTECLNALMEGAQSVAEVEARIGALFSDDDNEGRIVLSSTHKAKGLERDRVWILTWTYRKRQTVEEDNLWYVAVTRARESLFLVAKKEA